MDGRKYLSGTICLRGEDGTEATFEEIQKFGEIGRASCRERVFGLV